MCPNGMFSRWFLRRWLAKKWRLFDPVHHALFHVEHRCRLRENGLLRVQRRSDDLAPERLHRRHQSLHRLPVQFCRRVIEQQQQRPLEVALDRV